MDYGNGDIYAASYDTGLRLTSASLTQTSTDTVLYQTQPAYDAANNVVNVQTSISGQTDTQQFCYDSLNRLTWAGATGTPPCASLMPGTLTGAQYQQSYSYNVDDGLTSGSAGSYTYGDSSHPHAQTATGSGASASYDAEGNETCRATGSTTTCSGSSPTGQQLTYDPAGRLTTWTAASGTNSSVDYLYDGSGNRVAMLSIVNGTSTLTAYIGSIEEVQTIGGATTTTTYYAVAGKRVAANVNSTLYYLGYDALGSQVVVLNNSSAVVGSQLYGPYGTSRYLNGLLPTSIGFTGQQADAVTGLDYYNARYYDPGTGQILSADIVQGNAAGMDPYAYVGDDPESRTDPSGQRYTDYDEGGGPPINQGNRPGSTNWNPDNDPQVQALKKFFKSGDDSDITKGDLQGLTPEQVRAAVPRYATVRVMTPQTRSDGSVSQMNGVVFQWRDADGTLWQVEIYGPTNSGKGLQTDEQSTLHISQIATDSEGNPEVNPYTKMPVRLRELDGNGNWVSSKLTDPRSGDFSEDSIKSVHITLGDPETTKEAMTPAVVQNIEMEAGETGELLPPR